MVKPLGNEDGAFYWPENLERPINTTYLDEDRYRACLYWLTTGSLSQAAKLLGEDLKKEVPRRTLSDWYRSSWWHPLCEYVAQHEEAKIRANFRKSVNLASTELHDRIKNGDYHYDGRTGETIRVPVKAKDLAVILSMNYDKLRVSEGRPTNNGNENTSTRMDKFLKEFEEIANRAKTKDVVHEQ